MAEFFMVRYRKLFYCDADDPVRESPRTRLMRPARHDEMSQLVECGS